MELFAVLFVLCVAFLVCWGAITFLRALFTPNQQTAFRSVTQGDPDDLDGMNEGYYHDGPNGYSAMTAYPQTQYGSGFDEDADWHEEH